MGTAHPYIVTETNSEETKKPERLLRFFQVIQIVSGITGSHNILWYTKKDCPIFTFFSVKLPLSVDGSCVIMTVTDEFGRGTL